MGGTASFEAWLGGPFLRGYVTGPLIFSLGVMNSAVPGWNFISSVLFGWWACADYYSYNYAFFGGPLLPPDAEGAPPSATGEGEGEGEGAGEEAAE